MKMVCSICFRAADNPYRVYNPKTGKVINGCVGAFHNGHLVSPSESNFWHNRPGESIQEIGFARNRKKGLDLFLNLTDSIGMNNTPQTVEFRATFEYAPAGDRPWAVVEKVVTFGHLEDMILAFRAEKRRRAIKDRAVRGHYTLELTDYGVAQRRLDPVAFDERHSMTRNKVTTSMIGTRFAI